MKPIEFEILMRDKTKAGIAAASENVELLSKQIADQKTQISQLEKKLYDLGMAYKKGVSSGTDQSENIAQIQALEKQIDGLKVKLLELEKVKKTTSAAIPDPAPTVQKFNSLNMSIQQVARELPVLAMGPQMFFLAISNNLPILADSIQVAKKEYEALTAAGKKAVPVWKQMLGSIFSWQTAMTAVIMLSVMYGKEIGNWISGLFKSKKATDDLKLATEQLKDARLDGAKEAQKELVQMNLLYNASQDNKRSMSERKKAVDELQRLYPDYLGKMTDEEILAGKAATAYENLAKAIIAAAKARAAQAKITENEKTIIENEEKLTEARIKLEKDKTTQKKAEEILNPGGPMVGGAFVEGTKQVASANKKATESLIKSLETDNTRLKMANEKLAGSINIEDLTFSPTVKKDKTEESAAEKARKAAEQAKLLARELSREEQDMQFQIDQARIGAMDEGVNKTLAQLRLNHEKEKEELRRQKEDYLQTVIKNERAKFEADSANKGKVFDSSSVYLSDGQVAGFTAIEKMLQKKQNAELTKAYEEGLAQYQTYSEKRLRQIEAHNRKRLELVGIGASAENLAEMDRQNKEALSGIDKEFAMKEETFKTWMDSIANMTLTQLITTLEEAQRELIATQITFKSDDPSKNTQQVAVLRAQIKALQDQLNSTRNKESKDPKRTIRDWSELENVLSRVDSEIQKISESIGGTAGELLSLAGTITTSTISMVSGIAQFSKLSMETVEAGASAAAKAVASVEKASVILAVVSAAMQIMEKLRSFFSTSAADQWELEFQQARLDMQLKYNEALIKQVAIQDEMFGGDKYSNAMAYVEAYYKALLSYEEQYNDAVFIRQKKSHSGGWFGKNINPFYGAAVKALSGSETYEVNARENMQIQTRHKTWFRSAKYQNLEDWLRENGFGELFNEDGSLNLDLANSVLEMKGLTDETKSYLETLISASEQINEMNESLMDYLDDTFGALGDSMTNAIVDAFKNGSDAAEAFKVDMISVLEEVGAQMVRSLFLQKYIDDYSNTLEEIYKKKRSGSDIDNATAISREVAAATSDFFENLPEAQKEANKWLEEYTRQAEKNGFEIYTPDNSTTQQSGKSGAFTTITQDQATKLEGLFTSVQMHVAQMDVTLVDMAELFENIESAMNEIAENTAFCRLLKPISDDIKIIIRDGVKAK